MKKFIESNCVKQFMFSFIAMFMLAIGTVSAQSQTNYAGSSKFTDNWSITLQGGVNTTFNNFFSGHTAMTPIVMVGIDKYINPWLGVGLDARTAIGTGCELHNSHTAFDAVNVNGIVKFNVPNMFKYDGTRKFFEPVVYTGLGWGHPTCSDAVDPNYLTYRAGTELTFNLGKTKALGIVINPCVVWGDINNGKLIKSHGQFEITAGIVYHFKTSNGTHAIKKAHLYDVEEVARLNRRIAELEARGPKVIEKVIERPVQQTVKVVSTDTKYIVSFLQNSAQLSNEAKAALDAVPTNAKVNVVGTTSPEGTVERNTALAQERAEVVAEYLRSRGVTVVTATSGDAGRAAIVTVE